MNKRPGRLFKNWPSRGGGRLFKGGAYSRGALIKKSKIDEKVISKYTVTFFRIKNFFGIINDFTLRGGRLFEEGVALIKKNLPGGALIQVGCLFKQAVPALHTAAASISNYQ